MPTPAPNSAAASQAERKKRFSTTMAVLREDPQDVRARLQMVDLLQQEGRVDEAVAELLRVAAVYTTRGVPIKAVAVLRQAVKLQPDRADVRVAYGEVFQKLRMVDDAARELRQACEMYHQSGESGHELDALARLVQLDKGNPAAHLLVAEALSRAGRRAKAADMFRTLAGNLLEAGETGDWERVAERVIFHDPADVTTAHDLALHYVRSGRFAEALSKLIICFESEPNDVELLELIIETLDFLGQRDRAAALNRQLIARYRGSGLQREADAALERQHALDPDDEDAKRAMGVLASTVDVNTFIELQAGVGSPAVAASDDDQPPRFEGDFIDELMAGDEIEPEPPDEDNPTVAMDVIGAEDAPELPPRLRQESDGFGPSPAAVNSPRAPRALTRPSQPTPAHRASAPRPALRPGKETSPERPSVRLRDGRQRPVALQPQTRSSWPPASAARATSLPEFPGRRTEPSAPPSEMDALDAGTMPLIPVPARRAPAQSLRGTGSFARPQPRPEPRAPTSTESVHSWLLDEEEGGFDGVEDRTIIDADLLAQVRSADPPMLDIDGPTGPPMPRKLSVRPTAAPRLPTDVDAGRVEGVAKVAARPPVQPSPRDAIKATSPENEPGPRKLTPRRRSATLPRPRLSRSGVQQPERGTGSLRGISADLKTLDFFIERGFTESAIALLAELEKRHPNNDDLRLRRQRIAAMPR